MANLNLNFDALTKLKDWWGVVKTNFTAINDQLETHIAGTADKHAAEDITFNSARPTITADDVLEAIEEVDQRVDGIVNNPDPNKDLELVDLSTSSEYGTFATAKERADNTDVLVSNVMVASRYGVDDSIGAADATAILNTLFTEAKNQEKKYIYFDIAHEYIVDGQLTEARDLILYGNGKIKSSMLDNYYVNITPHMQFYDDVYNTYPDDPGILNTIRKAFNSGQTVNVTIWGDSISTGGGDMLGVNYENFTYGFYEVAPNGITGSDAFYHRIVDYIVSKFRDTTFNFYNRAIGGSRIQQYNDLKTFDSVEKAWIEHIHDTDADLLIIAWGMNNSTINDAKEFREYMQLIDAYMGTNFEKRPSIGWVTTPRPTMAIGDSWGEYDKQFGREMAAYCAREYGKQLGDYVIDVNKVSNIKRSGKSYSNPATRELAVTDPEIVEIIDPASNYTKVDTEYIFQSTENLILDTKLKDFVLEFDFSLTGQDAGIENLWVEYNRLDSVNTTVMLLKGRNASELAEINSYTNWIETTATKDYIASINWNDGVFRTLRIERRGAILDVFINSIRVLRDIITVNNLPGQISIKKNGGSTGTYKVKNIRVYEGEYRHYMPTLTEYEMWGLYEDGIYTTKPDIGGNGVNHPTSIGLQEVYDIAFKEFIDDLGAIQDTNLARLGVLTAARHIPAADWVSSTNTDSGDLRFYANVQETEYPKVVALQNLANEFLTFKPDYNNFSDTNALLPGEFASYNTAGVTQVILCIPAAGSLDADYTFTNYLNAVDIV